MALAVFTAALGAPRAAEAQHADETRIVSQIRATVRFDSGSYALDESAGTTDSEIRLIARTRARTVPPLTGFTVSVLTRDGTAESPDDYQRVLQRVVFGGLFGGDWVADGNAYVSRVRVPVRIVQDDRVEGDERFSLLLQLVGNEPTVAVVPADRTAPRCTADGCQSTVTIVDDDEALFSDEQVVHSGAVTIEAKHPTALQGIDDLVFTVTRAVSLDSELEVPVTLSAGIIDADRLSHTVTIAANETSAELRVHTRTLDPGAATGDVVATAADGEQYDVPDPPTASVRVHVGETLVTVRFNAESYMLAEGGGAATGEIALMAKTEPGVPAPTGTFDVAVSTRAGTASSPDDYEALSREVSFPGSSPGAWIADGDAFVAEVRVPLVVLDDSEAEGDETLRLVQEQAPGLPSTIHYVPADPEAQTCSSIRYCEAAVTIVDNDGQGVTVSQTGTLAVDEGGTATYTVVLETEPTDDVTITPEVQAAINADVSVSDALVFTPQDWNMPQTVTVTAPADDNRAHGSATIVHTVTGGDYEANGVTARSVPVDEWDAEGRTVVTLVQVPDGTVIPDHSTLSVGETVLDGSTFGEDGRVFFRLLFMAADGGRARYGADVELSFEWIHGSPIVPISGEISRIVLSLPTVDVWDSAVRILDNEVGNPDSTVRVRITGCERNACVIGDPSEITVVIADDDGGPEAAPPGQPATPWLLCPDRGHSAQDTGLKVTWETPDFEGGAPVEHYELRSRTREFVDDEVVKGEWQVWPHSVAATSATISGLEADVSYGCRFGRSTPTAPASGPSRAPVSPASPATSATSSTNSLPMAEAANPGSASGLAESAGTDPAIQSAAPAKRTPGRT